MDSASLYDRLSPVYDALSARERPYRQAALAMLQISPGETVLDIGCGTGQTLIELAGKLPQRSLLIGLDLSGGMLHQARQKLRRHTQAVALLQAVGQRIPLRAATCDAVFLSFTLELFPLTLQHRLLAEVRRVLTAGGRLGLLALSNHRRTVMWHAYCSLHETFPRIVDCRPIDVAPLLTAAGFSVIEQQKQSLFGLPLMLVLAK